VPPPQGPLDALESALPRSADISGFEAADSFLLESCASDTEESGPGQCSMARKGKKSFLMPCTWDTEEIPGECTNDCQPLTTLHCRAGKSFAVNVLAAFASLVRRYAWCLSECRWHCT